MLLLLAEADQQAFKNNFISKFPQFGPVKVFV